MLKDELEHLKSKIMILKKQNDQFQLKEDLREIKALTFQMENFYHLINQ